MNEQSNRRPTLTAKRNDGAAVYSTAVVTFNDGSTMEFTVKASPSVVTSLTKDMASTGYLTLWNDEDTVSISANTIKHFCLRQLPR